MASAARYEAGVLLQSGAAHTHVVGNRIEGPAAVGIDVQGQAVEIELRNNRVWNCETGVSLSGKAADKPYDLKVTHNTFLGCAVAGVSFDHPLAGPGQQLSLTGNYFGGTKLLLAGLTARPAGLKTAGNARDAASGEGPVSTDSGVLTPDPHTPTNPNDDATFLRSPSFGTAGAQRE